MANPKTSRPGTTRLALIIVGVTIPIIGFLLVKFAIFAGPADLKDIVLMVVGSLLTAFGAVVSRFFGKL